MVRVYLSYYRQRGWVGWQVHYRNRSARNLSMEDSNINRVIINIDGGTGALHKLVGQKFVNECQQIYRVCYMTVYLN